MVNEKKSYEEEEESCTRMNPKYALLLAPIMFIAMTKVLNYIMRK